MFSRESCGYINDTSTLARALKRLLTLNTATEASWLVLVVSQLPLFFRLSALARVSIELIVLLTADGGGTVRQLSFIQRGSN